MKTGVISALAQCVAVCVLTVSFAARADAQSGEAPPSVTAPELVSIQAAPPRRGPVTNLPLPRYVSLKAAEANVRRGPSLSHRIDWVFKHRHMPLRVTAEHGHWRRVEDREGFGGWVHYSLISGSRTVLIERPLLSLHQRPDPATPVTAALEENVVAHLGECGPVWCRLSKDGHRGWARKDALWGVQPDELRD